MEMYDHRAQRLHTVYASRVCGIGVELHLFYPDIHTFVEQEKSSGAMSSVAKCYAVDVTYTEAQPNLKKRLCHGRLAKCDQWRRAPPWCL